MRDTRRGRAANNGNYQLKWVELFIAHNKIAERSFDILRELLVVDIDRGTRMAESTITAYEREGDMIKFKDKTYRDFVSDIKGTYLESSRRESSDPDRYDNSNADLDLESDSDSDSESNGGAISRKKKTKTKTKTKTKKTRKANKRKPVHKNNQRRGLTKKRRPAHRQTTKRPLKT